MSMIQDFFPVSDELCALDERAREMCREQFARLDEIRRGLRLLEQINPALIANYEAELGR